MSLARSLHHQQQSPADRDHIPRAGTHLAPRPMPRAPNRGRHQRSGDHAQRYSSSEEDDEDNGGGGQGCKECEECARVATLPRPKPSPHPSLHEAAHHPSSSGQGGVGTQLGHSGGVGVDHHISPIENLDNTISRLYSYLSGSEGEPESTPHDSQRRWRGRRRASPSRESSAASSRSSSGSRCEEPLTQRQHHGTLDSAGTTGENLYSRITDTSTLPMPPIPPPPPDDTPGPAVPPRGNLARLAAEAAGRTYTGDTDPNTQFLRSKPGGTLYMSQGPPVQPAPVPPSMPVSGVAGFPRTVPRTNSLPPGHHGHQQNQHHRPVSPASEMPYAPPGRTATLPHRPSHNGPNTVGAGDTVLPPSNSTDRIKLQLKEMEDSWARQNVATFQTNSTMLPPLPTYPSTQNDFRDYNSRFTSTSYRVKKHLKNRCTWKVIACIAALLCFIFLTFCCFLIVMKVNNLSWGLAREPIIHPNESSSHLPGSGTTVAPVIIVQYPLGKRMEKEIEPYDFWRAQFYMPTPTYVKFNFTIPRDTVMGVYGRRKTQPSHIQYDFFQLLNGNKIYLAEPRVKRQAVQIRESAFLEFMEAGLWFVFIYNDSPQPQTVSFVGTQYKEALSECPNSCNGKGDCESGSCQCYPGYTSWDCSQSVCPILCSGNGIYVRGTCQCYAGWKGKECSTPEGSCENPTCSGNGKCVSGECICSPGWTGPHCNEVLENTTDTSNMSLSSQIENRTSSVDCLVSNCSGNGICIKGTCRCFHGFQGGTCAVQLLTNLTVYVQDCSKHGVFSFEQQACHCDPGWEGNSCQLELCVSDCVHGKCENQRCVCQSGWGGSHCDQLTCDKRCEVNGHCVNGSCVCKVGWNGRHCTLDGCPNACNNHGACDLFHDGYKCSCNDGWKGQACQLKMELECEDNRDEDNDGLVDCLDPDCCVSSSCENAVHCITSIEPTGILLRKMAPSSAASFYERMKFLVEDDSVQSYATLSSFNQSQVSVIRGKVQSSDGSALTGVRVGVVTQPLYGFTLTRDGGLFDILVNGGGSVTLQFQRQPFVKKQTTVMVPWNRMVTMEKVTLYLEDEEEPEPVTCSHISHDHFIMKPVVLSTWQHTQLGACPETSTIIPESQVLQESLQVPGTNVYLVYHSSETSGYRSTIMIQLTPDRVPDNLRLVHLQISVEGLVYESLFEADADLKYKFSWERRNAYNQKVYGIVTAHVGVGYEYVGCDRIFWEMQSATMSGYDITSSEIGGWNLHIHHTYNFQEGILHKGDGTNIYLKERPRKFVTVLGNSKQRNANCKGCDGKAQNNRLLAPVALASGRDGSLYVGDFNFIRKLSSNREDVASILQLSLHEVPYKYFMTVSPLDGKLYISDYQSKQITRVKTMGAVRELQENFEVIAGTTEQCIPGDKDQCGDNGRAKDAQLFYPKGIAIDKDGIIFFADGANIRVIDQKMNIKTLIGTQGQPTHWEPFPCDRVVSIDDVTLHWPTALAVNPLDDSLHILDNNMVLKVTSDKKLLLIAGRPLHCPPLDMNTSSLLTDEQSGPKLAHQVLLQSPQHIAFAPNGDLYIVESDGKLINRVRIVKTDGTISHYVGGKSKCNCQLEDCKCFDPKEVLATNMLLNSPTAITVTPDDVLHIADMGNLMIHSIVATLPTPNIFGQYHILYPQTQEKYIFNRYGQHMNTVNLITDQYLYNFTYTVNSYYGKLVQVTDGGGNTLVVRRDYQNNAKEIIAAGGQKCKFIMDNMFQLQTFVTADNFSTSLTYITNSGLLESKETTNGHRYLYEYDENGRLAAIVQPTGELTTINTDVDPSGAIASLKTDHHDKVAMATNGNMLSILHGLSKTKVSYLHDGALVVEYPFKMAVTMETTPHPLLSTEHQLQVKRKVILPDNLVHRLEWRYYLRREKLAGTRVIDKIGRRMRVGQTSGGRQGEPSLHGDAATTDPELSSFTHPEFLGHGYDGKVLLINGENLLTIEYDRETHTEVVMDTNMDEILLFEYNNAGQPTVITPREPVIGLKIMYNPKGQIIEWSRGEIVVKYSYDPQTNLLLETTLPDGAVYRCIYKRGNKPTDVILPSGKQYLLHYDKYGNLKSAVMPALSIHRFHSLTTMGIQRNIYTPPHTKSGHYVMDFDSNGKLRQIVYPSAERRISYYYTDGGKVKSFHFDWADVRYGYHHHTEMLQSVNSTDGLDFQCRMLFGAGNALVLNHQQHFNGSKIDGFKMMNAEYDYTYDAHFRITSINSRIGLEALPMLSYNYDINTGKLSSVKTFKFEYPRLHRDVIKDSNIEIIREYDNYGRLTDIWYRFNNYVVFTLEVKYDTAGRIHQWRRKVGSSDTKALEYTYDIDGNLIDVELNDRSTWGYEMDGNNNIVQIRHHDKIQELNVNEVNQIETLGNDVYVFDDDGFLIKRSEQMFEYNSLGQLSRVSESGKFNIKYMYDGFGRLSARHDIMGNFLTQYFYADVRHKDRITHIYEHTQKQLTQLYYDHRGLLFALDRNSNFYYIALDPIGSPILIYNSVGSVVKQMSYDPLGMQITDSGPDFFFTLGYRCGIVDHITKMIHLDRRVYDPEVGRWTSSDYSQILESTTDLSKNPNLLNFYQHFNLINNDLTYEAPMLDIQPWLGSLGYDMESLMPTVTFTGQIRPDPDSSTQRRLIPIISSFECAFQRDMHNFIKLSNIPQSKVTSETDKKRPIRETFAPLSFIFGDGVLLSSKDDRVLISILDSAKEPLALLATTLLNTSYIVPVGPLSVHGRDLHYFVKPTLDEAVEDVKQLSLRAEDVIHGINVTVQRHHETPEIMKYVDIKLHSNHTVLNLRYGTTVEKERERVLKHAKDRAVELAWRVERHAVLQNMQTIHTWTQSQKEELISKGYVSNMESHYIRDVTLHPLLADDPKNIRFFPSVSLR